MRISLDQFVDNLTSTGLMTGEEVAAVCDALPEDQRPADAQSLAKHLVRQGRLTRYQAAAIRQGKAGSLVFHEYVILDKLGAGGMGVVFKARHRRMKRVVAIKVLPAKSLDSPKAVDRFYREVEAAARLSHPNIVTAYDASEHQGTHYLVMEYVDGKDLGQILLEHGPLPVDLAVDCAIQAARGLAYAHSQGVVHRDIKPGNLLLARDGTVKILDLGLARMGAGLVSARLCDAEQVTAAQLTQSGQIMGTVDFMAPEQAMDTRRADHRADIYSLGCTLYRLLTGHAVFEGDTLMIKLIGHREGKIPSLCEKRADVPAALDWAFQKMIAKDRADRQQSMTVVIADLEVAMAGEPFTERQVVENSRSQSVLSEFFPPSGEQETIDHNAQAEDTGVDRPSRLTGSADESGDSSAPQAQPHTKVLANKKRSQRKPKSLVFWLTLGGGALGLMIVTGLVWFLIADRGSWTTPPGDSGGSAATLRALSPGAKAGEVWDGNGLGIKFCWCPDGKFKMGSPEDEPGRFGGENQVEVVFTRGFWLGQTEVTQGQWKAVMGTTPWKWKASVKEGDDYPATWVSSYDAVTFCEELTRRERAAGRSEGWEYRLPTEAQWEYACRAGTTTPFSFGNDAAQLGDYAWYEANAKYAGENYPHQVATKLPNPWGLHDLHGNAWEWCRDFFDVRSAAPLPGGSDPEITLGSNRVIRGGSCSVDRVRCRAALRHSHPPGSPAESLDFRLAAVQSGR